MHNFDYDNITLHGSSSSSSSIDSPDQEHMHGFQNVDCGEPPPSPPPTYLEQSLNSFLFPLIPMFSSTGVNSAVDGVSVDGVFINDSPMEIMYTWLFERFDPVKTLRLVLLGPLQEEMLFRAVVRNLRKF